jgi:hypothetical protein
MIDPGNGSKIMIEPMRLPVLIVLWEKATKKMKKEPKQSRDKRYVQAKCYKVEISNKYFRLVSML